MGRAESRARQVVASARAIVKSKHDNGADVRRCRFCYGWPSNPSAKILSVTPAGIGVV
jgi:hypothetical protein